MDSYPQAQIDLAALKHNLSKVRHYYPNNLVISVIKANAYGHGNVQVAQALADTDAFAVARLSEGLQLRKAGISKPIVLLEGVQNKTQLKISSQHQLSPVFHHKSQLEWLAEVTLEQPLQFVWLMVETGMHRLGFSLSEVGGALNLLNDSSNIKGEIGLMSHFANADLIDDPRNQQQYESLLSVQKEQQISMANSAAIIADESEYQQWLRPGIMLYGASPFANKTAVELDLKPVMQFKSVLIAIEQLNIGDKVGYGGDWIADESITVGVVTVGYGDGYQRLLSQTAFIDLNGKLVKVLGRVSMDMVCIDLSDNPEAQVGDEVILWGSEILPVEKVATWADTITYELLCQVSERVPRLYING